VSPRAQTRAATAAATVTAVTTVAGVDDLARRGAGVGTAKFAWGKALVLNATMEPLCVVPSRRAIVLVLAGKADLLHDAGRHYRSESLEFPVPSVVRLRRYVRVPYRRRAPLSRRGVFIRDDHTCQYCGRAAENVDHVHPRSRGGPHVWENVAASCTRCNAKKKDRTPEEARMHLRRRPYAPSAAFWLVVAVGGVEPSWQAYLHDALNTG
jgi:5-methylcytosine-specific restriction endonuclease McrA